MAEVDPRKCAKKRPLGRSWRIIRQCGGQILTGKHSRLAWESDLRDKLTYCNIGSYGHFMHFQRDLAVFLSFFELFSFPLSGSDSGVCYTYN